MPASKKTAQAHETRTMAAQRSNAPAIFVAHCTGCDWHAENLDAEELAAEARKHEAQP